MRRRSLGGLLYAHEGLAQDKPVARGEEVGHIGWRGCLAGPLGLPRLMRRALKEKRHRDLQDVRDVLQSTRADAIGALLVFLHLLEREAKRVAELPLAHAKHHPPHAHPAANVLVDEIGGLLGHLATFRGHSARASHSPTVH
jgi:hypothetical protein